MIKQYKHKKDVLISAESWANKAQKSSWDGNSYVHKVNLSDAVIYFQPSPRATNYHSIPKEFVPYLEAAIKAKFEMLCAEALRTLEAEVKDLAKKASLEYEKLLKEAGLVEIDRHQGLVEIGQ